MRKAKALKPPDGLAPDALARWVAVAPTLPNPETLDRDLLKTYCQLWVRWRQAEDGIARSGQLVRNAKGDVVASPLVRLAKDSGAQVRAIEERLGLGVVAGETGPSMTRRDLAAVLGVHMQTVTKWEQDGMPVAERGRRGRASQYLEVEVRAWLAAREDAAKQSGTVDVAQERARKERAQAQLAEQTHLMRSRKLLPEHEVAAAWSSEVSAVRAVILASYTTHADRVHRAATLEGLPGVERALKDLAYEVLRELADPTRAAEVA